MTGLQLLLIVAATVRITRLLQTDTILDPVRDPVRRRLGDRKVGELLWCPWCLSVWIGAVVVWSWNRWGQEPWWTSVAALCAASWAAGAYAAWEDR